MSSNTEAPVDSPVASRPRYLHLLLLIPFIALLWLPFYNFSKPALFGFPFFYWYQFLWVPLTSIIILIVYKGDK